MKQKATVSLFTILLLCCIYAVSAFAMPGAQGGRHGGPGAGGPAFFLLKFVDLSDDQKVAIEKLQTQLEQDTEAIRKKAHDARLQFKAQCETDVTEQQIREAFKPIAATMEEAAVLRVKMRKEIKDILTAEQAKKLETFRSEWQEMRKKRGHNFGPGSRGPIF